MSRIDTHTLSREDLPGYSEPVLSTPLLSRIHQLNLDYVELLIAEHTSPYCAAQLQHLPGKLHAMLVALSSAARLRLASLPFTLYSLGFEDASFWRNACGTMLAEGSVEQRYAPSGSMWPQGSFCDVALLHAWYVAASNRLGARVIYAMPDVTASRLARTPLWRIKRIAADYPALLMPRWPTNPGFWPDLLRFTAESDDDRLATAKLLGSQLIAAELESVTPRRRTAHAVEHAVASPRLRARKLQYELRSKPSARTQ